MTTSNQAGSNKAGERQTIELMQRAAEQIAQLRAELQTLQAEKSEPIAIIGMGCRFPGPAGEPADSPERFWQLLQRGGDAIREIPASRWALEEWYEPNPDAPGKMYTSKAAFLEDVDRFDADFFGITPREAISMDPQQRLLLEVAWQTLESAGIAPASLFNSQTGVFVGMCSNDYQHLLNQHHAIAPQQDLYSSTGTAFSVAAGRLAYTLGFLGPAVAIDTACSSSLVALHQACQSLRNRECTFALAGGVNLILRPEVTVTFCKGGMLSAEGHCKTFDAAANGFARGEGCGMVALKRLSDAQAAGDTILAVIRGSAINQDGRSSGLTAPSGTAQQAVIRQALQNSKVEPAQVSYIEAHGTGTPLGDPVEIAALSAVFRGRRDPLWVGSLKTNIGHLEGAAGIASVIKVVLALQHGQIPPHLHFHRPNPYIDWTRTPIQVPTALTPWGNGEIGRLGDKDALRVAGVSSFGFSGTNAHIVLAEAPPARHKNTDHPVTLSHCHLVSLSAKNEQALKDVASTYLTELQTRPPEQLADLCYTTHVGRNHFAHRLSIATDSHSLLQAQLAAYLRGEETSGLFHGVAPEHQTPQKIAFLFTGQGSQYVEMGRQLYESQPIFRRVIDQCDVVLRESLGRSLIELLYPDKDANSPLATRHSPLTTPNDLIDSHPCGQAANFALECALVDLWRSWGIVPDLVLGHSLGDFAAAYCAGVLSLEDGLRLVVERGRLMERADGEMLSVMASEAEVLPFLAGKYNVTIGVINGPRSVVISGERTSVNQINQELQVAGFKTRKLAIPVAAHSALLDPVLSQFEAAVRRVRLSEPQLLVVSSMTGKLVTSELTDPAYWRQHLRNTVRFADGVQTLHEQGVTLFLEIGPKPTLLGIAKECLAKENGEYNLINLSRPTFGRRYPVMLPSLRSGKDDGQQMLESLGELYVHGAAIDWKSFHQGQDRRKIVLPTYPFQRQRYWIETPKSLSTDICHSPLATRHSLLDRKLWSPLHNATIFESDFSLTARPWLADHRVFGKLVSPGAAHVAMMLNAFAQLHPNQQCVLEDIVFLKPLSVTEQVPHTTQLVFTPDNANHSTNNNQGVNNESIRNSQFAIRNSLSYTIQLLSFSEQEREAVTHASSRMVGVETLAQPVIGSSIEAARSRCPQAVDLDQFYAILAQQQIELGLNFRWITEAWQGQGEILGKVCLPDNVADLSAHLLHPGLLDACFQVAVMGASSKEGETKLPFALQSLTLHQPLQGKEWWCRAWQNGENGSASEQWQVQLVDLSGQLIADLQGFQLRTAHNEFVQTRIREVEAWRNWLYEPRWRPQPIWGLSPTWLPAPSEIANIQSAFSASSSLLQHQQSIAQLENSAIQFILRAFQQMGLSLQTGARWRTPQLTKQLLIISRYHRLFRRLLKMLEEVGLLQAEEDGWRVVAASSAMANLNVNVQKLESTAEAEWKLFERTASKLSEVLRGVQDPLELLFPGGDATLVTQIYQSTPAAQQANRRVQQLLQQILTYLPSQQGVRILEIGAGTGGTTAALLSDLPVERVKYTFTDIGAAFLGKAQEKFADYPFIAYAQLDIEQPPGEQGFAPHQYDIIIAANVLHATQDLPRTLSHIHELLAKGGQLILLETTTPRRWIDLTFGLTEGWWRFADARQDQPLLTIHQWEELLQQNGFHALALAPDEAALIGQGVIVARTADRKTGRQDDKVTRWQGDKVNKDCLITLSPSHLVTSDLWSTSPHLIFADAHGVGAALAATLQEQGEHAILVYPGERWQQGDDHHFHLRPDVIQDYQKLFDTLAQRKVALQSIVYLWGSELNYQSPVTNSKSPISNLQSPISSLLHLTKSLLRTPQPARLWLVTRCAQWVEAGDSVNGLEQSALWGMGRVIGLEHPELACTLVDLAEQGEKAVQAELLAAELRFNRIQGTVDAKHEDQVALRQQSRHVLRLSSISPDLPDAPLRLEFRQRGVLDNLQWQPLVRRSPSAGEVEIRVAATGLNFIDVLDVLGLLPFERQNELGGECAGEIVAVGEGVKQLHIGDRVVAMVPGSFSRYVTTATDVVYTLPDTLNFQEAASLPLAFITAAYTLQQVAKVQPGERVLIHAAAGGTGMAAVQIAQRAGAEVFATASPGKWGTLRALGIRHIYNSRTLDFADAILRDTNGQGVDVILNSLTGEGFIEKNLSVLVNGGRYLEISKRDVWDEERVKGQHPNIAYHFVDLRSTLLQAPQTLRPLFEKLLAEFGEGKLHPLPITRFPMHEAVKAFRTMRQAKHVGKIVLAWPEGRQDDKMTRRQDEGMTPTTGQTWQDDRKSDISSSCHPVTLSSSATYLITGGLGGLGLLMARWMVEQGARHLLLIGRSQPKPEAQAQLSALRTLGAEITVAQADVADEVQLKAALAHIDPAYPLRGLIHAVGVLDDGALLQQEWSRFATVLAPKVQGAWNLHWLTEGMNLDFFVLFASAAGFWGNRGQANHAAANSFLDALAHHRQTQNLPALSIDWGIWSEIGAAATLAQQSEHPLVKLGYGLIRPEQGVESFAWLLAQRNSGLIGPQVSVVPIDWHKFKTQLDAQRPFFVEARDAENILEEPATARMVPQQRTTTPQREGKSFAQQLESMPAELRLAQLIQHLRSMAAKVMGNHSAERIDLHRGLMEMGMDSLMAVELRNHIASSLNRSLPSTLLFDYPTVEALANHLIKPYLPVSPTTELSAQQNEVTPPAQPVIAVAEEALEEMSDDEVGDLLLEKLGKMGF